MILSFIVLEQWGKTPMDLGLPQEELDGQWLNAMLIIKAGYSQTMHSMTNRNAGKRPH